MVEEAYVVSCPVAVALGDAPMLQQLSPRWLIPLTVVVLLLPSCSASDADGADTTPATTTTAAAKTIAVEATTTTTSKSSVFDFSSDDLCDWFSARDIEAIVAQAYQENGASPFASHFDEGISYSDTRIASCAWEDAVGISTVSLAGVMPGVMLGDDYDYDPDGPIGEPWIRHPALSEGIYINDVHSYFALGEIDPTLVVEGQERVLAFFHDVRPGFNGDAEVGLAIVEEMLRQMGWIPVEGG